MNLVSCMTLRFLQTFLVWQLLLSTIVLDARYSFRQIVGCLLVATGVVVAVSRYVKLSKVID